MYSGLNKNSLFNSDGLMRLLIINVGVFLIVALLAVIGTLFKANWGFYFTDFLALPSNLGKLALRPWTLITYMFFHEGLWHLLINMLMLYFAGMLFREFLGTRKLVAYYVLGGLVGGLLYVAAYNIFPLFEEAVLNSNNRGASAGVMAVIIGVATYRPQTPVRLFFMLEVRLWIVALIFVLLDLLNMASDNAGGHIAHLGGALFGYVAMRQYLKGKDWSQGFMQFLDQLKNLFTAKPKLKTVYSKADRKREEQMRNQQVKQQARMDDILDKISRSGYESLSKEEKDFLFKIGRD